MTGFWQAPYDETLGRYPGHIGPLNQSYGWRDPVWWRPRTAGSTMLQGIAADVGLASSARDRRMSSWKSSTPAPAGASLFSGQLFAALRSHRAGNHAQAVRELAAAKAARFSGTDRVTSQQMIADVSYAIGLNYDVGAGKDQRAAVVAQVASDVRRGSSAEARATQDRDDEQTRWVQSGDMWAYAFSRPDNAALSQVVKGARVARTEIKEGATRAADWSWSVIPPRYRLVAAIAVGGIALWQGRRLMLRVFG